MEFICNRFRSVLFTYPRMEWICLRFQCNYILLFQPILLVYLICSSSKFLQLRNSTFFSHLFPKKICNYEKFSQRICSHHNINVHMFWILTKMGEFLSIPTNDKSEIAFCTFTTTPPHCTQIKIIIRFYFIVCEVYPVRYPKHTATIAWLRNENSSGRTGKKAWMDFFVVPWITFIQTA